MSEADKSKPAYGLVIMISGLIGIVLFCTFHELYTLDFHTFNWHDLTDLATGQITPRSMYEGDIEPTWALTPLFILPVLIGLLITKRVGFIGLIFLTLAVTSAHYLAQTLGTDVYRLFARIESHEAAIFTLIGAIAGAIGSAVSFIAFAALGKDLRDGPHFRLYALSTIGLSLTGALAFLSMMFIEPASNKWIFQLYLPWQLAFTLAIARIFQTRTA